MPETEDYKVTANLGLLDAVQVLKWLKENSFAYTFPQCDDIVLPTDIKKVLNSNQLAVTDKLAGDLYWVKFRKYLMVYK